MCAHALAAVNMSNSDRADSPPKVQPRVAVIGAGAVGVVIAAAASAQGAQVTLCVRSPVREVLLRGVDGVVRVVVAETVTAPADLSAGADVVFVATKATDTAQLGPWLERLDAPRTVVIVAQNGLSQASAVEPLVQSCSVLPALVLFGAERTAAGAVTQHRRGPLLLPEHTNSAIVSATLAADEVPVETVSDFHTEAWRKLMRNAVGNPITALTLRRRSPELMSGPAMRRLVIGLLTETICVAQADGANVHFAEIDTLLALFQMPAGKAGSSTLYDRLAGRPLESEAITGEVVRRGQRLGVPTPLNEAMLALLNACAPPGAHRSVS
jgi:2-dehydropantoate 2-reductase